MFGGHFSLMRVLTLLITIYIYGQTSIGPIKLWGTANPGAV